LKTLQGMLVSVKNFVGMAGLTDVIHKI
jgi:hypothetical protein